MLANLECGEKAGPDQAEISMGKVSGVKQARSREAKTSSVSSTTAQNTLGEIIGRVMSGERVFITRYGRPQTVMLSVETYEDLIGEEAVDLGALEQAFDDLVGRMQGPDHAAGIDTLFGMSGQELGEAAVREAKASGIAKAGT